MTVPAWFWPPSGETARGVSLIPFGAGLAVADWTQPSLWPFSGNAFSSAIALSGLTYGIAQAYPDSAGGAWIATLDAQVRHMSSGGVVQYSAGLSTPTAAAGGVWCAGSGFMAAGASGQVYTSGLTVLGSFALPGHQLFTSGSTLATLMGVSGVGTMNSSTGATGFIGLPTTISTPLCMTLASGALAVGGYSAAPVLSGMVAASLDPQDATRVLAVGSGRAIQWTAPNAYADAWSQAQILTGLASLNFVTWRPDGTQALATSVTSGAVQVLAYAAGSISLAQTLSISGAVAAAIAGSSVNAVVAQSGQSQVTPITYGGSTWSTGTAVTGLTGITSVAAYGASGAVAAVTAGLQYLNLTGGTWSLGTAVALPFTPAVLTTDIHGQVYAAASGAVALISGATLVASGTWAGGTPSAIAVQQGRIVLAVPTDGLLRMFALSSSGTLSQQYSGTLPNSSTGLGLSTTILFAMQSSGTAMYSFSGVPYAVAPVQSGAVGIWNGSSWSSSQMGVGNVPAALGFDASGNVWTATQQNTYWHVGPTGAFIASGAITQYSGQTQTVPICPSAVLVASGSVFVATSIPGVLEQIA